MKFLAAGMVSLALAGCVGDWNQLGSDAAQEAATQEKEASVESVEPALDAASVVQDPATDATLLQTVDATSTDSSEATTAEAPEANPVKDGAPSSEAGGAASPGLEADPIDAGTDAAKDAGADAAPIRTAAIANVDTACSTPLELACSAHNVAQKLVCLQGKWSFDRSCDGATRCDTRLGVSQGTCQPITGRCVGKQPGAAVCDGLVRKSCGFDLLDELPSPCTAHAHCEVADASCVCDRGFMPGANGDCIDIPDCPAAACNPGGRCVDGLESYSCNCDAGYRPAADAKSCVELPHCKPGICGVAGTCHDVTGDYECSCASGYKQNPDKKGCTDIPDCPVPDPCAPGGVCVDGVNSAACACNEPYVPITYEGGSACFDPTCICGCGNPCGPTSG